MKILQLIDHMGYGGAPVAVSRITKRLMGSGIDVSIGAMRKTDIPVNVSCSVYTLKSGKYSVLRAGLALRKLCREKGVDLIHAHLTHSLLVACMFSEVPVIYHEHGAVIGREFWSKIHRKILKRYQPRSIACSGVLRNALKELGVKATTIGNPIDLETWKPDPKERRFIRRAWGFKDDFIVGYLGRLAKNKNLDSLVYCAWWLKYKRYMLHGDRKFLFYIIGDGPYREKMQRQIRDNDLEDMFKFYGQSERPQRLVHSFDCAVQVAERGSFGQAVLELMAARVPVVVPPVGAFSEIIEDRVNGFIATNTTGRALSDCVLTVANNHCNGILDRAQETAQKFADPTEKYIEIYREVL